MFIAWGLTEFDFEVLELWCQPCLTWWMSSVLPYDLHHTHVCKVQPFSSLAEIHICIIIRVQTLEGEQVFRVKNSWGTGVPLNSNYLLATSPCMFSKSDSCGYSIVVGLKDTSRYTRPLGLQEFQVSRAASHPVKAPLPNCQMFANCFFIYMTY